MEVNTRIRDYMTKKCLILAGLILFAYVILPVGLPSAQEDSSNNKDYGITVVTNPCRGMIFEDRLETSGNVESKNYALVSARVPGVIDDIYFEEGDFVTAGKTDLFQTDKIKLSQAKEIAKHGVVVAEFGYKARMATIARTEADLEKARIDYERYKRLYEDDNAVTKNAFETQESRYKQLQAALEEARAGASLAFRQMEQARSRLIIAEKDLEDSLVKAPISGHVSNRFREPGEMAGAGVPVLRIDDLSVLEISAFLPAQYYTDIKKGQTKMLANINGIDAGDLIVTYRSPIIDSNLRNFEVKSLLRNPKEGIVPGSMAKIDIVLESHEGIGVPIQAVLKRSGGKVIFLARGGKAQMVRVETGLETDGWIEIILDNLQEGGKVITMGQDKLNDGSSITILREDKG